MSDIAIQSQQTTTNTLIYRLHHLFFAVCIVLGIVATLSLVATSPQYYSTQNGTAAMFAAFAAANPVLLQAHFIAGVFTVYLLPVSLLLMAWLTMRRIPWFATIIMLLVFISTSPFAAFSAQDALTYDLAHMGSSSLLVTIAEQFNNDGVMSYYNAMFIVGTVLAPTLIGIALWRTQIIPTWAAVLITFSRLLVFVYPFTQSIPGVYIQLLSWTLLLIGSIPAALAMVNISKDERQISISYQAK